MKIVAAILGIIILLMPMEPILAGFNCVATQTKVVTSTCCSKKKMSCHKSSRTEDKKSPHKPCDKKNCPMEACCSCCCFIVINRPVFEVPYVLLQTRKIRLVNENSLSTFISDCWHPPEFV